MSCDDDFPAGASANPPREPDCKFRTIKRYFEGPVIARCTCCENLVAIEEVGDQEVTMPCGVTWSLNARSILQSGG
jgi:hypothetical protein